MTSLWLGLVTALVAPPALLNDDFEQGLSPAWRQVAGTWSVIAEPGRPANHVLALRDSPGGVITAGADWGDITFTARVKLETAATVCHLKLGVRQAATGDSVFLNLRNDGPIVVRQQGNTFRQIGRLGDEPLHPGEWYRTEVTAVGGLLEVAAWPEARPEERREARFQTELPATGGVHITVWRPNDQPPLTLLVDDVAVRPAEGVAVPQAEPLMIEDDVVRVTFHPLSGELTLEDKRTGLVWRQQGEERLVVRAPVHVEGRRLEADLELACGPAHLALAIEPGGEVTATLSPGETERYATTRYPFPVLPPDTATELVMPLDEGILLPVTDVDRRGVVGTFDYQQFGWLMPWAGFVKGEAGLMLLVETPADFAGHTQVAALDQARVTALGVDWLASLRGLRYPRVLRYCLFAQGGYVAMAKRYRRLLLERGRFRTLADKAEELPQVARLLGAINILDQSRDGAVLDWMIGHGVRRALYSCGGPRERVQKALDAGYVVNRYDIYTDVAGPELLELWGPPKDNLDYRRIGYPEECFIRRDGTPLPGFAYPVGAKGGVDPEGGRGRRVRCYKRRTAAQLAWMKRVIPPQLAELGYTARFIDVETAHPPYESYHLEGGPTTREQDLADRVALFDYLRSLGQVCSSEGGADYANMALHYQEGSLTLNRLGGIPGVYVGTAPFKLPEEYVQAQLDPTLRVPLHKLVYHDSTLMTWRWNHTPNRWDRRELWNTWDLLHVLYGGMPIFVLDGKSVADCGDRVLQTYHQVCEETERFAGQEMISHRFVTPDRMVQETRFANGRGVIVNFGDRAFASDHGEVGAGGALPFAD